jgi:hypothetical protein
VDGSATIDGVTATVNHNLAFETLAIFSVGSGPGFIDIRTYPEGDLLAKADIIGYIEITSTNYEYGPFGPGGTDVAIGVTQTFNILTTPEPASAIFVGAVLVGYAIKRRLSKLSLIN